jgi:hypothetical protein
LNGRDAKLRTKAVDPGAYSDDYRSTDRPALSQAIGFPERLRGASHREPPLPGAENRRDRRRIMLVERYQTYR